MRTSYILYGLKQYAICFFCFLRYILRYMYYRLSNTAERSRIERLFGVSFDHPNLYRPEILVNGLVESSISIITSENPARVSIAIWGLLPENCSEDWGQFQNLTNTLNTDIRALHSELWYAAPFRKRKCLILVTGFFTSFLRDGSVYPYYVGLKSGDPFYLAGIYNRLEDGFITCSLVVGNVDHFIKKYQNVVDCMPLIVPKGLAEVWLNEDMPLEEWETFLSRSGSEQLRANPIAKEFFNQNISYDSMLEPYGYDDLSLDD